MYGKEKGNVVTLPSPAHLYAAKVLLSGDLNSKISCSFPSVSVCVRFVVAAQRSIFILHCVLRLNGSVFWTKEPVVSS